MWTGLSKDQNVLENLTKLLNKGLLCKREEGINGKKKCFYTAIIPNGMDVPLPKKERLSTEKVADPSQKSSAPLLLKERTAPEKVDNNIIYNIKDNIEDNIHIPPIPQNDIFPDVEIVSEYDFEIAWNLYGNIGNEYLSRCEWNMLSLSEKQRALEHIPKYNASISDIRYKKAFQNYLKLKEFTSSIINRNGPTSIRKSEVTDDAIAEIVSRNYKL
jgi:hypothetical protein